MNRGWVIGRPVRRHKKLKMKGVKLRRKPKEIVIDLEAGLVFGSEKELYGFFRPQIELLEKQYLDLRKDNDITEDEVEGLGDLLDMTLDEPAEIWHDEKTFKEFPIFHFIRPIEEIDAFHIAVTYVSNEDEPTFIFLHFVTRNVEVVTNFRRGDLVYDRAFEEIGFGAIEGDALSEGDPMAMGLFLAMLKLRSDKDVVFEKFQELGEQCRESTIETADEIWRSADLKGNTLVTFIKQFSDHSEKDLSYITVTKEDPNSSMHSLLLSFPTNDENLLDRYRHGENLQAEEVVQESSH